MSIDDDSDREYRKGFANLTRISQTLLYFSKVLVKAVI